jgi:hypothetical protein
MSSAKSLRVITGPQQNSGGNVTECHAHKRSKPTVLGTVLDLLMPGAELLLSCPSPRTGSRSEAATCLLAQQPQLQVELDEDTVQRCVGPVRL